MAKRRKDIVSDASPLMSSPFAGLVSGGQVRSSDTEEDTAADEAIEEQAEDSTSTSESSGSAASLGGRIVVRRQKKGQGGKTVICVEGIPQGALAGLLRRIRRELGCGGRVAGSTLVLGTSAHERVAQWLEAQGDARVVRGN